MKMFSVRLSTEFTCSARNNHNTALDNIFNHNRAKSPELFYSIERKAASLLNSLHVTIIRLVFFFFAKVRGGQK